MTDQDIDQVIKQAIDPSASHHARVSLIPMLVAAIRADLSPQPKVKPLVWEGLVSGPYEIIMTADGTADLYNYGSRDEDGEPEFMQGGYLTLISIDGFKAIAQADHDSRILSALE